MVRQLDPAEKALSPRVQRTAKSNGSPIEVIPYIPSEPDEFEEEARAFLRGERDPNAFMTYRLRRGVYGQRQPDRQMVRVKIPGGILTADALDALGEVAERYAPLRKGHTTTRDNIQFHHVPLAETPKVMRLLGSVGLTTREACGNTVRNITTCPMAGVCRDEEFDVTPYLAAYARYFVRNDLTINMPRKFKTGFSPCKRDCVVTRLHDMGFVAEVREVDGVKRKGFKVVVGGGTSIQPKLAEVLYDWVPVEEYLRVAQAVLTVYNKADELRKNKMAARIKVLIHRIGMDAFRQKVEEELASIPPIDPTPLMLEIEEPELVAPPPQKNGHLVSPEYLKWRATNVVPQRQQGYNVVYIKLPLGDITAEQFHALAAISREFGAGQARVDAEQNLALRWVHDNALYAVWQRLSDIGLAEAEVHTITDIGSCPGTDSCKMGITSSMGLGRAIKERLLQMGDALEDPLVKKLHIKMSGCPNGCGRHHLGNIGFHGAAMKGEGGQQVPAYELFLGGDFASFDSTRYGVRVPGTKVPAKRVPEAVAAMLDYYRQNRQEGEEFNQFVDRVGPKPFEELLASFRELPPLTRESIGLYMDWDKAVLYKVERGEGECAV